MSHTTRSNLIRSAELSYPRACERCRQNPCAEYRAQLVAAGRYLEMLVAVVG